MPVNAYVQPAHRGSVGPRRPHRWTSAVGPVLGRRSRRPDRCRRRRDRAGRRVPRRREHHRRAGAPGRAARALDRLAGSARSERLAPRAGLVAEVHHHGAPGRRDHDRCERRRADRHRRADGDRDRRRRRGRGPRAHDHARRHCRGSAADTGAADQHRRRAVRARLSRTCPPGAADSPRAAGHVRPVGQGAHRPAQPAPGRPAPAGEPQGPHRRGRGHPAARRHSRILLPSRRDLGGARRLERQPRALRRAAVDR